MQLGQFHFAKPQVDPENAWCGHRFEIIDQAGVIRHRAPQGRRQVGLLRSLCSEGRWAIPKKYWGSGWTSQQYFLQLLRISKPTGENTHCRTPKVTSWLLHSTALWCQSPGTWPALSWCSVVPFVFDCRPPLNILLETLLWQHTPKPEPPGCCLVGACWLGACTCGGGGGEGEGEL